MQFNIKPAPANVLKKPSELDQVWTIKLVHESLSGRGIALFCPECGVEHSYEGDNWPLDIRIVCSYADEIEQKDCNCIFIIPNDVAIED